MERDGVHSAADGASLQYEETAADDVLCATVYFLTEESLVSFAFCLLLLIKSFSLSLFFMFLSLQIYILV